MVADSTSRWAEALREVAGRLGQMPVEEGYPAYLASRLTAFYERAGNVETLNGAHASVTLIGAVSPPGGDFSEPVTSHTKEIVQTFWALSKQLADARHYPSVDWNDSFSGYVATAAKWWDEHVGVGWIEKRGEALGLLAQADELARIVNLVGPEALSPAQRWTLEGASLIKDAVLQQSALDDVDSYCSPQKQYLLLDLVLDIHHRGIKLLGLGAPVQELISLPVLGRARRVKSVYRSDQIEEMKGFRREIETAFDTLGAEYQGTRQLA
jgi:V/A-type H+-transporting ATPase subunit A